MRFSGKTILITGAASGIGRAVAERLAGEGAERLILVDVDDNGLADLSLNCSVQRLTGDVSDEAFWTSTKLGRIDHAVINAGISGAGLITELEFSEWRRILSVNLDGAFLTMRAALRHYARPGEIAGQIAFLLSDECRTITGSVLVSDGGYTL